VEQLIPRSFDHAQAQAEAAGKGEPVMAESPGAGKILKKLSFLSHYGPALPFLIIACMFELMPLAGMIIRSFTKEYGHTFTLDNYIKEILLRPVYIHSIKSTLRLSFLASLTGLVIVFITAGLLTYSRKKIKRLYMTLLTVTSNFWGVPLAFSFISLLGASGFLVLTGKAINFKPLADYNLYTLHGLFLMYIYFQIPMGTLLMLPAFEAIRPEWQESAKLLQASPLQFWTKVGIPVMIPSITGTFSMLFANAMTAYATPMVMVNNAPLMGINIAVIFIGDNRPKPNMGSAFSMIMLAFIFFVLGLSNLINRICSKGGKN
jgi:putative spermidine/putrescine transport system permease protein